MFSAPSIDATPFHKASALSSGFQAATSTISPVFVVDGNYDRRDEPEHGPYVASESKPAPAMEKNVRELE